MLIGDLCGYYGRGLRLGIIFEDLTKVGGIFTYIN